MVHKNDFISELISDIIDFNVTDMHVCSSTTAANDLTTRVDILQRKHCFRILSLCRFHEDILPDFVERIPEVSISNERMDLLLKTKYGFQPPLEKRCSNGDTFAYVPISNYLRTHFLVD